MIVKVMIFLVFPRINISIAIFFVYLFITAILWTFCNDLTNLPLVIIQHYVYIVVLKLLQMFPLHLAFEYD